MWLVARLVLVMGDKAGCPWNNKARTTSRLLNKKQALFKCMQIMQKPALQKAVSSPDQRRPQTEDSHMKQTRWDGQRGDGITRAWETWHKGCVESVSNSKWTVLKRRGVWEHLMEETNWKTQVQLMNAGSGREDLDRKLFSCKCTVNKILKWCSHRNQFFLFWRTNCN